MNYLDVDESKLTVKLAEHEQRIQQLERTKNSDADYHVKQGESIQKAIDDPSNPYFIQLESGSYTEDIVIDRPVKLFGTGGFGCLYYGLGTIINGSITFDEKMGGDYFKGAKIGQLSLNGINTKKTGIKFANFKQSVPHCLFEDLDIKNYVDYGVYAQNVSDCTWRTINIMNCGIGIFLDVPFAQTFEDIRLYGNKIMSAHIISQGFNWNSGVIADYHKTLECDLKLESCLAKINGLWIENANNAPNIDMVGNGKYGANRAIDLQGWFHNAEGITNITPSEISPIIKDRAYGIRYHDCHFGPGKGQVAIHKLEGYGWYVNVEADNLQKIKVNNGATLHPISSSTTVSG